MTRNLLAICYLCSLPFFFSCSKDRIYNYPILNSQGVEDNYFGKKVIDSHRILENTELKEVKQWVKSQSDFFNTVISQIPSRDSLKTELSEYIYSSHIRSFIPRSSDKKVFYSRYYVKEENIYRLFYFDSLNKKEVEIFNTIELNKSTGKIHHVDFLEPSYDGKLLVLGISQEGYENSTIHIYDLLNNKILGEKILRTTTGYPNWLPDNSGFFYNQLKEIKSKEDEATRFEQSVLKLHKIGDDPRKDKIVLSKNTSKLIPLTNIDFPILWTFPSSKKALLEIYSGSSSNASRAYIVETEKILTNDSDHVKWKQIVFEDQVIAASCINGDDFYCINFTNSINGVVEKIDLTNFSRETILKSDQVVYDLMLNKKGLYIKYNQDGINKLKEVNLHSGLISTIRLPFEGSIDFSDHFRKYDHGNQIFIGMEGWTKEFGIYNFDGKSVNLTNIRPPGKYSNAEFVKYERFEVPSYDGELVPLTIIYPKNLKKDGSHPVIITAYGSFGSITDPFYNPEKLVWFKRGGIYAIAHVRGGGEKGDGWYKAGFKSTKQNTWKDFEACTEFLIKNNFTNPEKIAAIGESAGAIPIGRAFTDKPQLYKAGIIGVGLLNSLRFENSNNTVNTSEFGTSKDSLEFKYLYDMDVYHHIDENVKYPSILLTAGLQDQRVEIWQPAKAVARFQEVSNGTDNIVLFRVAEAGHMGDEKIEDELTDRYSFLFWQLGISDFQPK